MTTFDEIKAHSIEDNTVPINDSHELSDRLTRCLDDRAALIAMVKHLQEIVRGQSMGTTYTADNKPVRRHCMVCDQFWDANDASEHHLETCMLNGTSPPSDSGG